MIDIMFMRQKQNETARLIWNAPKGPLIRLDQISKCCSSSSLEQQSPPPPPHILYVSLFTSDLCSIRP